MSDSNTEHGIQVVSEDPGNSTSSVAQAVKEYEDCEHLGEAPIAEFKEQVFTEKLLPRLTMIKGVLMLD